MTKIYIQKTWHGLILSYFFTKFWGLFDSYWGWVFTDALKNSETFTSESHNIFFWGFGCFTGVFFFASWFLETHRGARTIRTQTTTVLVEMLVDDAGCWMIGGDFFFWFLLWILLVITWKNANDSVVFSQNKRLDCANCTNVQSRKVLACNLKKNTPSTICGFFLSQKCINVEFFRSFLQRTKTSQPSQAKSQKIKFPGPGTS